MVAALRNPGADTRPDFATVRFRGRPLRRTKVEKAAALCRLMPIAAAFDDVRAP